jgi:hypothetical protein
MRCQISYNDFHKSGNACVQLGDANLDVQRTSKYDRLMGHARSVPDGQPQDI